MSDEDEAPNEKTEEQVEKGGKEEEEGEKKSRISFAETVEVKYICKESPIANKIVLETQQNPLDPVGHVKARPVSTKPVKQIGKKRIRATLSP